MRFVLMNPQASRTRLLVGITEHVGLIQVGIAKLVLVEVAQQPLQGAIRQHALVTVLSGSKHVLQFGVVGFDGGEGFIQRLANIFGTGNQIKPAGTQREATPLIFNLFLRSRIAKPIGLDQLSNTLIEYIVEALKK